MEREQGNPEFAFLFDNRCPEHAYYRWRLFSLASGDTLRRWVGAALGWMAGWMDGRLAGRGWLAGWPAGGQAAAGGNLGWLASLWGALSQIKCAAFARVAGGVARGLLGSLHLPPTATPSLPLVALPAAGGWTLSRWLSTATPGCRPP